MTNTPWRKATYSGGNGGSCVEVRRYNDMIEVRDTKDQGNGPTLRYTKPEWDAFLRSARDGEFNDLLD